MLFNGRRFLRIIALIITAVLSAVIFCACKTVDTDDNSDNGDNLPQIDTSIFSVHFLSVGQGDCIFINFPDGKIMLIDLGPKDDHVCEYIKEIIKLTGKDKIDYLVLSHPDEDHVSNTEKVLQDFSVDTAYLPYVLEKEKFPAFSKAYDAVNKSANKIEISEMGKCFIGKDYFVCFIWPKPKVLGGYNGINLGDASKDDINGTSAVIYLEYLDKRFLFTGDVNKTALGEIIDNYKSGVLNLNQQKREIKLENIDYLKVPHHGSSDSINQEFYELTNPTNAIISVGAANDYNHPSTSVLTNLEKSNIYRTDINGTISVAIDSNGRTTISKQI